MRLPEPDAAAAEQALRVSGEKTKEAVVTRALEEFIARRKQTKLLELMGRLEWDTSYDYKVERSLPRHAVPLFHAMPSQPGGRRPMPQFANMDPALSINPGAEQVAQFLALDASEPVVFVNLHRYRPRAAYPADYDGPEANVSGREAYHRYLREVETRFLPQVGARFLIVAPVDVTMIGAEAWDEAVVGHYPSRRAALELPALPGYTAIAVHRLAGLEAAVTVALGPDALRRLPRA